jgi:hypothetical protein
MADPFGGPCPYCIDGYQPIGKLATLGYAFSSCIPCEHAGRRPVCTSCVGDSFFPTDNPQTLTARIAARGMLPVYCGLCGGVTDLIPTDAVPEVNP